MVLSAGVVKSTKTVWPGSSFFSFAVLLHTQLPL